MKIAVLGWGSLIWEPGDLTVVDGKWHKGGPQLPIELSRLSEGRQHFTYVIDERHKRRVPTRYAISERDNLEDAIAELACREGCKATSIGFVLADEAAPHRARHGVPWQDIHKWVRDQKLDAAIWTDLKYKFDGKWDLDTAVAFWKTQIPKERLPDAAKYASSAPPEVDTDLRRRLVAEGLIPPRGAIEVLDARMVGSPSRRDVIRGIFEHAVFGFIQSDIEREIYYARQTEEAKARGESPGPHAGGGNYLAALGLLCYTEYLGAFKTGRRGTDEEDKPRRGQAEKNFRAFLHSMGEPYRDFESRIAPARVYNVYRNGFAHEYSAKGPCEVAMVGTAACGLQKRGNVYEFIVEQYFNDFMNAARALHEELIAEPRLPS